MVKIETEQDVKVLLGRLEDVYNPEEPEDLIDLLWEAGIDGTMLFTFLIEQGLINNDNLPWLFEGPPKGAETEEEEEEPCCQATTGTEVPF
jgi:hypothetical protein